MVALTLLGSSSAHASTGALAELQSFSRISAHGGWVVWSVRVGGGWGLQAWRRGAVIRLPVRPRRKPFDLDLGTDRRGRTVGVFTRCARYDPTANIEPFGNRGCAIRVYDLATGRERAVGEPRPRGTSSATPSIWRGRIAYSQYRSSPVSRSQVSQVYVWSPITRRLVRKPHGRLLACRTKGCDPRSRSGWVDSLDLGDRLLAFVWYQLGPESDHPSLEMRADGARDTTLIARGVIRESCSGSPYSFDTAILTDPAVEGSRVWFGVLASGCTRRRAWVYRYDAAHRRGVETRVRDGLLAFARDGATTYGLLERGSSPLRACSPAAPCTLERLALGRLV